MHYLWVFVAGYTSVFLLGFQSRMVNHGNFMGAALCSFCIAQAQVGLWLKIITPQSGEIDALTYGLSGACAITSAMWVHRRFIAKL